MKVTFDALASAAYIELSGAPVVRTKDLSGTVMVDLDAYDVVVGVELLNPAAAPRARDITKFCYVSAECVLRLDQIFETIRELRITESQPTKNALLTAANRWPENGKLESA